MKWGNFPCVQTDQTTDIDWFVKMIETGGFALETNEIGWTFDKFSHLFWKYKKTFRSQYYIMSVINFFYNRSVVVVFLLISKLN